MVGSLAPSCRRQHINTPPTWPNRTNWYLLGQCRVSQGWVYFSHTSYTFLAVTSTKVDSCSKLDVILLNLQALCMSKTFNVMPGCEILIFFFFIFFFFPSLSGCVLLIACLGFSWGQFNLTYWMWTFGLVYSRLVFAGVFTLVLLKSQEFVKM